MAALAEALKTNTSLHTLDLRGARGLSEQRRARWHDCAGGGVDDQYGPEDPKRWMCALPCISFAE
eukprot:649272-Pleurochrysis_carterae.AAC.1